MTVNGRSSSTPFALASFTRSACRLKEYIGSCHLPVTGCLRDRKGFEASEGTSVAVMEISSRNALESEDEMLRGVLAGAVEALLLDLDPGGGGYRAKNCSSLGGSVCASLTYLSGVAIRGR